MKLMKKTLAAATAAAALTLATSAQAHLVTFGWTDNQNGTITLWGEHWHGDHTTAYSDNGGITISGNGVTPYTAQWAGVLNNSDRDAMMTSGVLTGWAGAGNSGSGAYDDWFYTDALVLGNGTWDFITGSGCCVDTMGHHVSVTLTGIQSVAAGTGPSGATSVPEPASLALLGLGLVGVGLSARKAKKA